jgi:putative FmdB family regulatory protein
MPNYGFICNACGNKFDRILSILDREQPLTESCSSCGEKNISRDFDNQTSALMADSMVTPNSKTGGDWNELMSKMKKGLPKYTHGNLDIASNRNMRKWQQ